MERNSEALNAREAANYLGAHVETIRRLARRGDIPAYKIGKDWRFRKSALLRWAEQHHERSMSRSAHVLIVDDEETVRGFIRRTLEPEGYRVSEAPGGAEGLDLMRQETPDAVLLDLKMPGMSGAAVLKDIRESYGALPVIIITGYPDSDLMAEALKHAPVLMLPKPVEQEQLVGAVRLALGER